MCDNLKIGMTEKRTTLLIYLIDSKQLNTRHLFTLSHDFFSSPIVTPFIFKLVYYYKNIQVDFSLTQPLFYDSVLTAMVL